MLAAGNVGVQTLTIWAQQNLHSVSFSVRLKISLRRCCLSSMLSPSGICSQIRSADMGGASAVLARLVVPARPVKMSAPSKCPQPPTFWPSFPRKIKNFSVRLKISLRRCCLSSMQSPSGICSQICSAYMGGVSAVLAQLVVPARLTKICQNVRAPRNVDGRRHFDPFSWVKSKS